MKQAYTVTAWLNGKRVMESIVFTLRAGKQEMALQRRLILGCTVTMEKSK